MLLRALLSSYEYVYDELEGRVYDDVYQYDDIAFQSRTQHLVYEYERKSQEQYGDESLMLRHSGAHQFVVYVVLVSLEYGVMVSQTSKHGTMSSV